MMRVRDVMTVNVIAVDRSAEVKDIVALFLDKRISGVPVMDGDRVVGMLSEADLLPLREGPPRPGGSIAGVLMRAPVVALREGDSVTEAARILERNHIKRAPVLRDGVLVGIVTRSDLLRPYLRSDAEIQAELEEAILRDGLGISPRQVRPRVDRGVVTLVGDVADQRERALLLRMARMVDGVIDVIDDLRLRRAVEA